jgi:predicted Zn-dependent protease
MSATVESIVRAPRPEAPSAQDMADAAMVLNLASVKLRFGNMQGAADLLYLADWLHPRHPPILQKLAIALIEQGKDDQSVAVLNTLIGLTPKQPAAAGDWRMIGRLLIQLGMSDEARRALRYSRSLRGDAQSAGDHDGVKVHRLARAASVVD